MSAVVYLPAPARTLQSVRSVLTEAARNVGASEQRRLRAFGVALRLLADGASSAWAVQAGRQDLRGQVMASRFNGGGEAA